MIPKLANVRRASSNKFLALATIMLRCTNALACDRTSSSSQGAPNAPAYDQTSSSAQTLCRADLRTGLGLLTNRFFLDLARHHADSGSMSIACEHNYLKWLIEQIKITRLNTFLNRIGWILANCSIHDLPSYVKPGLAWQMIAGALKISFVSITPLDPFLVVRQ